MGCSPPGEELPKASLSTLFFEGVPYAEPRVLGHWRTAGALDSKTYIKWVWAFIDAIANLVDVGVIFILTM